MSKVTLYPNVDVLKEWSYYGTSDHYTDVNESTPDEDDRYIFVNTPATINLYSCTGLPGTASPAMTYSKTGLRYTLTNESDWLCLRTTEASTGTYGTVTAYWNFYDSPTNVIIEEDHTGMACEEWTGLGGYLVFRVYLGNFQIYFYIDPTTSSSYTSINDLSTSPYQSKSRIEFKKQESGHWDVYLDNVLVASDVTIGGSTRVKFIMTISSSTMDGGVKGIVPLNYFNFWRNLQSHLVDSFGFHV